MIFANTVTNFLVETKNRETSFERTPNKDKSRPIIYEIFLQNLYLKLTINR